jgi:hypothetical protein
MAALAAIAGLLGVPAEAGSSRPSSLSVLRATGGSMRPVIRPGDWLFVSAPPSTLRSGDVAVFDRDGELVVHRILSLSRRLEQGDACRRPGRFLPEQVVGQVVAVGRDGRTRDLGTAWARAQGARQVLRGHGWLAAKTAMRCLGTARRVHERGDLSG